MLYKEWKMVRYKFWLYLAAYLIFAYLLTFVWSAYRFGSFYRDPQALAALMAQSRGKFYYYQDSIFMDWLYISAIITAIGAIFGGMDAVAEEKDKGTLGFLLARPITRAQIYNTKIWLNSAGLLLTNAIVTLIVFVIDQTGPDPSQLELLPLSVLVLLGGITIVCMTALISIFASNVIQTLTFSIAILIAAFAVYIYVTSNLFFVERQSISTVDKMLLGSSGVALLALIFYPLGLYCFERKEF